MSEPLHFSDVIGPFICDKKIPTEAIPSMANKFFEFYVPSNAILDAYSKQKVKDTTSIQIYPSTLEIPKILAMLKIANPESATSVGYFKGLKICCTYLNDTTIDKIEKKDVTAYAQYAFQGARCLIRIIKAPNFTYKDREDPNKYGMALIFAEPICSMPKAPSTDVLKYLPYASISEMGGLDDIGWVKFGLTGEPLFVYNPSEFNEENIPSNHWFINRLKHSAFYFETSRARFEMILDPLKMLLSLYCLKDDAPNYSQLRAAMLPVPDDKKMRIGNNISLSTIKWSETNLEFKGLSIGPIEGICWISWRRPHQIDIVQTKQIIMNPGTAQKQNQEQLLGYLHNQKQNQAEILEKMQQSGTPKRTNKHKETSTEETPKPKKPKKKAKPMQTASIRLPPTLQNQINPNQPMLIPGMPWQQQQQEPQQQNIPQQPLVNHGMPQLPQIPYLTPSATENQNPPRFSSIEALMNQITHPQGQNRDNQPNIQQK